jgi:methylthioribose-1-phosphate isomerase
MLPTIRWSKNKVVMIDQRRLPLKEVYVECRDHNEVASAIEKMVIRGAPAIGVAAAFGLALGFSRVRREREAKAQFGRIFRRIERTRPTARNLFWALERMKKAFQEGRTLGLNTLKKRLIEEALKIEREDVETNRKIGSWGKELIKDGDTILTHCNAGALATAGYGTALGVVRAAFEDGKRIKVYVDETRPFLQGARLTCWELRKLRIPFVLITDNMAGWLMRQAEVSLVVTGADRIARNGDAANKIGTYALAVLAREHRIPFYVAAPMSTVDLNLSDGSLIPIEERPAAEVIKIGRCPVTVPGAKVRNPAFDVTPGRLISAIITERGIARPPYAKSLKSPADK